MDIEIIKESQRVKNAKETTKTLRRIAELKLKTKLPKNEERKIYKLLEKYQWINA